MRGVWYEAGLEGVMYSCLCDDCIGGGGCAYNCIDSGIILARIFGGCLEVELLGWDGGDGGTGV